jgi:2-oxoglutarate dehydrogenase complex dihydrolipoamide succinyltransferase (E2) component
MGESVVEGTIGAWRKKVGDPVARDEVVVEILTDKITVEVPSAYAGRLGQILVAEGDVVKVGEPMALLLREGEADGELDGAAEQMAAAAAHGTLHGGAPLAPAHAEAPAPAPAAAAFEVAGRTRTSPALRRKARDLGIDLSQVSGSGPKGRIRQSDLEALAGGGTARRATPADARPLLPVQARPAPAAAGEPVERLPFGGVRKLIAQHMVNSRHTSAHVTTLDEVDMTRLVEFRNRHKERILKQYGVKLTYMPFIIRAVTSALKNHPRLNASLTDREILLKKFYHIGVAVARDEGLIVPVVKYADAKGILQLAGEMAELADRARREALTPDDVSGGTFTITNAGMFGALASTPVIHQPQVAILGVHAIQKRPVVRDGQIVARDMMYLVVSFDHRLIDGHTAVQFLREVCENLEEPAHMLLS